MKKEPLFLKRTEFDPRTRTYSFADGSGVICEEAKMEMELGAAVTGKLPLFDDGTGRPNFFDIKERYSHPKT